jgi:hypothetical protein
MADFKKIRVHTLASLSEVDVGERISGRTSRHQEQPCITEALVTAATLTHEQNIGDAPKALIKLGGKPVRMVSACDVPALHRVSPTDIAL